MSPLLSSGLEVMEHAIEHLKMGTERDMKFAVQHADNAVELLLKELARFKRIRLINKSGQPISYYQCIERLENKGVGIPELTDIDLLHTERNSTYHRGSQPDKERAEWLVYDVALRFVERVCKDELGFDINNFSPAFKLPQEVKEEIKETRSEIVNMYLVDALNAFDAKDYSGAVIGAYSGLEAFFRELSSREIRSHHDILKVMKEKGIALDDFAPDLEYLYRLRNRAAHGDTNVTKEVARLTLDIFQRVTSDFSREITEKEKRKEIGKRLLPEHYESWEKMLTWVDEETRNIVKKLTIKIKKNMKDVVAKPRGRYFCFFKGKPSRKSIFVAFLLTKKYLNVKIRTDPTTFRDPKNLVREKVYSGWFFKTGQERMFTVKTRDVETIAYAIELIKHSYGLAK